MKSSMNIKHVFHYINMFFSTIDIFWVEFLTLFYEIFPETQFFSIDNGTADVCAAFDMLEYFL